jgi:predicted nucleic acid-binding protein
MRFWDTSAIVPLVLVQPGSSEADRWVAEDRDLVAWTLTPVELVSAIRRLVRDGDLSESAAEEAEALASDLLEAVHLVVDVERVKALSARLLRVHALRAADAMQLAAALAWADGAPDGRVFHTYDRRLAIAARREGFRVVPAPDR